MACTVTPRRSNADATFAGAPDQVRSSRGLPNTEVIATRSKRGRRKLLVTASRGSVVSMYAKETSAPRRSRVINLWLAHQRHRLITFTEIPSADTPAHAWSDRRACARRPLEDLGGENSTVRQTALLFLSRRHRCEHAEARSAVHRPRLRRHRLRLSAQALQYGLRAGMAARAARPHRRRQVLASPPRFARRDADHLRPSLLVQERVGVLRPQHRPVAACTIGSSARAVEGADCLRGARHPADLHAPRPGSLPAARDRAILPALREGAGAVLAGLSSWLLRGGAEVSWSVVPA